LVWAHTIAEKTRSDKTAIVHLGFISFLLQGNRGQKKIMGHTLPDRRLCSRLKACRSKHFA